MQCSLALRAAGVALCALASPLLSPALAATTPATGSLKICASTKEPPFSTADGQGFENRIATVIANAMGLKAEFVWADKPAIYLVRDFLDQKACDVVVGLDAGDERVLTTKPYYRSGYVFITRTQNGLPVTAWNDPRLPSIGHIAIGFGSPAEVMLRDLGLYEDNAAYLYSLVNFRSPRNQYTQVAPDKLVAEVASGNAGLAVAFAPEVARYVKTSAVPLTMTMIPNDIKRSDGQAVPHHFSEAMAVRKDDGALRDALDQAIIKAGPEINRILDEEGIPRLAEGQ